MSAGSGPLLQLLAAAVRLWIRQQCEALDSLELELEGSALQLLRGNLAGVRLEARGVHYQGLEIDHVRLRSEGIQVQLPHRLGGHPLRLEQSFGIEGRVRFSAEGLERSLHQESWQPLADQLAQALLGTTPLLALGTRNQRLLLTAQPTGAAEPVTVEAELAAEAGSIALRTASPPGVLVLPMDPAITIQRAAVEAGGVVLEGQARVTP